MCTSMLKALGGEGGVRRLGILELVVQVVCRRGLLRNLRRVWRGELIIEFESVYSRGTWSWRFPSWSRRWKPFSGERWDTEEAD